MKKYVKSIRLVLKNIIESSVKRQKKYAAYIAMDFVFSLLILSISLYTFSMFLISVEKLKKSEEVNLSRARIFREVMDESIKSLDEEGSLYEDAEVIDEGVEAIDERYGFYEIRKNINIGGRKVEGVTYAIIND